MFLDLRYRNSFECVSTGNGVHNFPLMMLTRITILSSLLTPSLAETFMAFFSFWHSTTHLILLWKWTYDKTPWPRELMRAAFKADCCKGEYKIMIGNMESVDKHLRRSGEILHIIQEPETEKELWRDNCLFSRTLKLYLPVTHFFHQLLNSSTIWGLSVQPYEPMGDLIQTTISTW